MVYIKSLKLLCEQYILNNFIKICIAVNHSPISDEQMDAN